MELGSPEHEPLLPRIGAPEPGLTNLVREEPAPFLFDAERQRVDVYTSCPVRDRIFRRTVLQAYDSRCAITGLKFINGGGAVPGDEERAGCGADGGGGA